MIQSNLKEVIHRLERLQAGIPLAVARALAPAYWDPKLRSVAEKALRGQFALFEDRATRARYEELLPRILDTVAGKIEPGGALFTMGLPAETISDVNFAAAAKYAGLSWTPSGRARKFALPDPLAADNLEAARQAVLDWVTLEKQRDERDDGLSNEQIAERMEVILGLRPSMRERNDAMDEAAAGLRNAIEAWLAGAETTQEAGQGHAVTTPSTDPLRNLPGGRQQGLTNGQARQWLEAVLQTWIVYFRIHLRDRIEEELDKLHKQIQARQGQLI